MAQRNHYSEQGFSRGATTGRRTIRTIRELREIGENVLNAAKEALKNGADIIVADAKNRCPVKTGALRDSIKATPKKNGAVYSISANASKTDSQGRKFYYGQAVEFDPKIRKPFLYPAMNAHREEVYNMVENAVKNAIGA